jgi:hypothetical protein
MFRIIDMYHTCHENYQVSNIICWISLDFTMLLGLEYLFPFSLSPPLAGGKKAVLLGVILLILNSCDLPVF